MKYDANIRSVLVVWTLFTIASKPEYLEVLQNEADTAVFAGGSDRASELSLTTLDTAKYLDSFLREILRWRGLTLFSGRTTTQDTELGPYIIPKGRS